MNIANIGSIPLDSLDFGMILCGPWSFLLGDQHPWEVCARSTPLSGFLYPPVSILFLAPLGALPTPVAFIVLTILSVTLLAAVIAAIRALAADAWPKDRLGRWGLPLLIVSLAPVTQTLMIGHFNIVVLATFVTGGFFASRHYSRTAGLIVAIGFWLKLYPVALVALFLSLRELRPAAFWSASCSIALALLSLIWIPQSWYMEYFSVFLPAMQKFTVPGHSQSIAAQLVHLDTNLGRRISTGDLDFIAWRLPFSLLLLSKAVLVAGFGLAVAHIRRGRLEAAVHLEALAIILLTLLLYSPVAWTHHFVLAIPAMAILLMRLNTGASRVEQALTVACWLALAVPGWTNFPHTFLNLPGGYFAAGAFYMRYTLSALCMVGLLVAPSLRDGFLHERPFCPGPPAAP